jgi:hypothetical protein
MALNTDHELQEPSAANGEFDLHKECMSKCRLSVITKYIEMNPERLAVPDMWGSWPLHRLLFNSSKSSTVKIALMLIEKYPAAFAYQDQHGNFPLHAECWMKCRSAVIRKCIELYPEALSKVDTWRYLLLHRLLWNEIKLKESSCIEDALMMIEKYPAALQHRNLEGYLPLHIECKYKFRSTIILKCEELYPGGLDDRAVAMILKRIDESNIRDYAQRKHPRYRRRVLNLLQRHVFTPKHESDYRDLNWQPRAAMMMFLSQIQQSRQQQGNAALVLVESLLA